jgi:hypothetical protein
VGFTIAKEISASTHSTTATEPSGRAAPSGAYIEARGAAFDDSSTEIVDLIADLLHLTATIDQGFDPIDSTLRLARMHFEAERAEGGGAQ